MTRRELIISVINFVKDRFIKQFYHTLFQAPDKPVKKGKRNLANIIRPKVQKRFLWNVHEKTTESLIQQEISLNV